MLKIGLLIIVLWFINNQNVFSQQIHSDKHYKKLVKKEAKKLTKSGWHSPPYTTVSEQLNVFYRIRYNINLADEYIVEIGRAKGKNFFDVREKAKLDAIKTISYNLSSTVAEASSYYLKNSQLSRKSAEIIMEFKSSCQEKANNFLKQKDLRVIGELYKINNDGSYDILIYLLFKFNKTEEFFIESLAEKIGSEVASEFYNDVLKIRKEQLSKNNKLL